jgi:hypothetical protein
MFRSGELQSAQLKNVQAGTIKDGAKPSEAQILIKSFSDLLPS